MFEAVSSQVAFNVTIFASLLVFMLGLWVSFQRRDVARFRNFGVVVSVCFIWVLALAFYRRAESQQLVEYAFWLVYALGLALPAALLSFSCSWSKLVKDNNKYATAAFVSFGLLSAWLGPQGAHRLDAGVVVIAPWLFVLYLAPITISLLVFMVGIKRSRGKSNSMAAVMLGKILMINAAFSILFTGNLEGSFNLWAPLVFFVAGLAVMTMFLGKLKLLVDLRFVAVETLVMIVLFIFVSDLVGAASQPVELAFRLAILSAVIGLAGLLTYNLFVHMKHVHENELLRERMLKLSGQLIEADRNKTEFVALVAHQLQSPLSGIHIYLEMARNGDFGELTPELDKILKDNIEVIDRLLATNETFLDVTKIDLGRVELIKSSTDLVDLSRRVVGELGPRAKQKGLSIRLETPFNQFIVKCDATYIHHALTNLVDNAVKYTESGGVTVSLLQEGQRVKIMVTDTGRGMVEKDMDRLFGVFQRGMAAVDLQAKGAGLGLYIVKQFIEAHGGRVFFSSPGAGQGSVFGFELTLDS